MHPDGPSSDNPNSDNPSSNIPSHPSTRRAIRHATCPQCGSAMHLVMFEPAEAYGSAEDAYLFRCDCGATHRETVARLSA